MSPDAYRKYVTNEGLTTDDNAAGMALRKYAKEGSNVKSFEGKTVIVTGGSSGIGRAAAIAFGGEGARVVIADVQPEEAENTLRSVRKAGGQGIFVRTDVTKSAEVEAMVLKTIETYGQLHCAVNNAGIVHGGMLTADYPEADWDRVLNINLKGVFLCMKYEIPQMLKRGGGSIVNTASVGGIVGVSGTAAYVASKHGVVGLTKTAALDYAQSGIRVNAVCPGTTLTPPVEKGMDAARMAASKAKVPMGRMGKPEDMAAAILWLSSDAASFVTGHTLVADGGRTAE